MTVIAGVAEKGHVYIGGDSAGTNGYTIQKAATGKVFRVGEFVIGCAGSRRANDLIRYSLSKNLSPLPASADLDAYMTTDFITALRACFREGGALGIDFGQQEGFDGNMLVGVRGNLYLIDAQFAAIRNLEGFNAVGSGAEVALGALHVTKNMKPEMRVRLAMEAAERWTDSVRGPFTLESL
ncbi:MAG TPA: hypothetical protein VF543_22440 [Pyrinomonadaceae bacterium]|jgi:ATP-dependent protease HslVU (ClpYQ) peptidase subunit